jgi:hypothetical protein
MNIPFCLRRIRPGGRGRGPDWEPLAAAGMNDRELARLNHRNTRDFEGAPWAGLRLLYGDGRRP